MGIFYNRYKRKTPTPGGVGVIKTKRKTNFSLYNVELTNNGYQKGTIIQGMTFL